MKITRTSTLDGKQRTMDVNITPEDFFQGMYLWCELGWLIQDAFPDLTADEREFIMNGITPDEWNILFEKDIH